MNPIDYSRIETLRRNIALAKDRKAKLEPGSDEYTEENALIAKFMRAISRLQSDVEG